MWRTSVEHLCLQNKLIRRYQIFSSVEKPFQTLSGVMPAYNNLLERCQVLCQYLVGRRTQTVPRVTPLKENLLERCQVLCQYGTTFSNAARCYARVIKTFSGIVRWRSRAENFSKRSQVFSQSKTNFPKRSYICYLMTTFRPVPACRGGGPCRWRAGLMEGDLKKCTLMLL